MEMIINQRPDPEFFNGQKARHGPVNPYSIDEVKITHNAGLNDYLERFQINASSQKHRLARMIIRHTSFLLLLFWGLPISAVAEEQELNLKSFQRDLTNTQKSQFIALPTQLKSLTLAKTEDEWVLPEFYSFKGEVIAIPKTLDSTTNLTTTLNLPLDAKTSIFQFKGEGVDLNSLYYNSESLILKEFYENYRTINNKRSVGPGEIPIIDQARFPYNEYSNDVVLSQQSWASDPCNVARAEFRKEIELKIRRMFPKLSSTGVLSNSWDLNKRRELAKISNNFDQQCLMSVIEADEHGLLPGPIKSRMAILTRKGMPFCGAFRVAETKFLTARHCFFDSSTGKAFDYTNRLISKNTQGTIQVHVLNDILSSNALQQNRRHAVKTLIFDGTKLTENQIPYWIDQDFIFIDIAKSALLSKLDESTALDTNSLAKMYEPLMLIGYYAFHNAEWRFQLPKFEIRPWREGLRLTRGDYCRVFDRSKNGKCIAHGCQSMVLFSGGPLISAAGLQAKDGGTSKIRMLGVHAKSGDTRQNCGVFEISNRQRLSAVGAQGGFAVSSSWIN